MKRKFKKPEPETITGLLWIFLIIMLIILFNVGTGKSQEYDCTVTTSGVLQYSTLDSGKTWQRVLENRFLVTAIEFPIGYGYFLQTVEDTTIRYRIQPNSLKFDTISMHLSLLFCNEWSDTLPLLVFNE